MKVYIVERGYTNANTISIMGNKCFSTIEAAKAFIESICSWGKEQEWANERVCYEGNIIYQIRELDMV